MKGSKGECAIFHSSVRNNACGACVDDVCYTVIQAMKVYTCDIVTLDWLLESVEAKKQLPGKDYLFETKKKNDTKDDNASADDTKDSKKSEKSKEDDKPPKKRPLEEALKEEDDGHLDKKQKDGQLAKSKDLKVDVDDGCYLRSESNCFAREGLAFTD